MSSDAKNELYQQVILEHNKKPRNFKEMPNATYFAEGYNPLCGDHLKVYVHLNEAKVIDDISFVGDGCAISKASASMMTQSLKGKTVPEAKILFEQFHSLIKGSLNPDKDPNILGKLAVFSGIWHYPARVKCASLGWHTLNGALENKKAITTE
ncbi:MAG: SUF system NifU family Fe-S cluster assembly protein [Omnitrophica WOR_2 bacterium RIFCSPHIGHO2_01_FULL_48_9]|nr:MAG: SUF system NifU family Fe-S cluster assembly protein [Omnitrophica WOR_2 bacterium RIFCSPHIGHO2_01_FULL_48_9]